MDPVNEVFKKLPAMQAAIPAKAVYAVYDASTQATGRFPQEGERCRAYVALDLANMRLNRTILDRNELARTAIVPVSVYHRYLEVIVDALPDKLPFEGEQCTWLDLPMLVKHFNLMPLLEASQRIHSQIVDGNILAAKEARAHIAISVFLASTLRPGHVDLDVVAAAAMCTANKALAGYAKSGKVKCRELFKLLKKNFQQQASALAAASFVADENDQLSVSDVVRSYRAAQDDSALASGKVEPCGWMLDGRGTGIFEFCGLPSIASSVKT